MNDNKTDLVFSLYSRPECDLCDKMLAALKNWQKKIEFDIEVFNIDESPELIAKYAARIPLLSIKNTEICEYCFDEISFLDYLNTEK